MKKDTAVKVLLLVLTILYFISPVDACPGPLDDLIVIFMSFCARKRLGDA